MGVSGPGNLGPDSWLLLEHKDYEVALPKSIAVICIESKKREGQVVLPPRQLELRAQQKTFHISGVLNVLLYVTDQHRPKRTRAQSVVSIDKETEPVYYGACCALLKSAFSPPQRSRS